MKFFIPDVEEERLDEFYNIIIDFVKETTGSKISRKKIYSIEYKHDLDTYLDIVGQNEIKNNLPSGEMVFAILEAANPYTNNLYFVCTPSRGVFQGAPILVGEKDVIAVKYFE